ncbi:hypothetical protein QZH41_004202 [Actinostola sp. cb2023]|nr:hypothetical protein QZH41_004202 [Actinostola sp. cb2023]
MAANQVRRGFVIRRGNKHTKRKQNYTGRQRLVGYWGQNGAGPANGPANYEKSLAETCRTTKYDIIAVSFVISFWDLRDKGKDIIAASFVISFWDLCDKGKDIIAASFVITFWDLRDKGKDIIAASFVIIFWDLCDKGKDIIAVSFVIIFWDLRDKDHLPALNFAFHCETPVSPNHPFLLRCVDIEKGIKECQKLGKKIIMSVGGATGDGTLPSPAKARELANTFYHLFLGGNRMEESLSLRPFGSAVMDGIDLDIEGGRGDHYGDFIKEMRRIMDADQSKEYILTGAPQCPYPDHYLGPGGQSGLELAGELMDHLYIQFYNNYCHTGAGDWFESTLKTWIDFSKSRKPRGPLIFIGMPAATKGASGAHYYRPPSQLKALYQKVRDLPFIGGIMLWDVSWDQNNVIGGKRYSEYAFAELKGSSVIPPPVTQPPVTQPPVTDSPVTQPPVTDSPPPTSAPASFSCSTAGNGMHANPSDCSKFIQCFGGRRIQETSAFRKEIATKEKSQDSRINQLIEKLEEIGDKIEGASSKGKAKKISRTEQSIPKRCRLDFRQHYKLKLENATDFSGFVFSEGVSSRKNKDIFTRVAEGVINDYGGKCPWSNAQLRESCITYYKSLSDAVRRKKNKSADNHNIICRRQGRMREKLSRRKGALKKVAWNEATKKEASMALTLECTSSDESEYEESSDTEEPELVRYQIKPLPLAKKQAIFDEDTVGQHLL